MHLIRDISAFTQTLKIKMLIQYNGHRKHGSSLASTYVRVFQDYQGLWVKKRLLQILHLAIKPPLLLRSDRPGRCKAPLSINIKGAAPRHFKSHGFQIVPNSLLFRPFRQLEHRQPWLKIIYQFDLIVKAWGATRRYAAENYPALLCALTTSKLSCKWTSISLKNFNIFVRRPLPSYAIILP